MAANVPDSRVNRGSPETGMQLGSRSDTGTGKIIACAGVFLLTGNIGNLDLLLYAS